MFAVDLKGAWLCAKHVLPAMRRAGRGSIVNIASIHATLTIAGDVSVRGGQVGAGRPDAQPGARLRAARHPRERRARRAGRARAWSRSGSRCSPIPRRPKRASSRRIRCGRIATPEEVANLVAFVASDEASAITGASLAVDCGLGFSSPTDRSAGDLSDTELNEARRTSFDRYRAAGSRRATTCRRRRKRFADGGQYRIEIPSCEGPRAMQAVIAKPRREHGAACTASARAAASCCRPTTRSARWWRSAASTASRSACSSARARTGTPASRPRRAPGRVLGSSLRGADQLAYGIEDVLHGVAARHSSRCSSPTSAS